MMFRVVLLCAICAFVVGATGDKKDAPVSTTSSGTFKGSWMETRRGRRFQAYRGIRYAEPPVGELRFQPPVLMKHYAGPVDASAEGPACPLPVKPGEYYVDEDCLRINVYTPDNNSSLALPVIFFIHAGGFYSMTGRSDLAGPHYLLDQDVVLVTINYRLASLGFLSTGDALAPGNNGMKDQVAALRWVQRNIAGFGGDPGLVTITGCSAGSISVMLHMISPMSKGLFHRAISMSASPTGKETTPHHYRHLAVKQAQLLNCPTDNSTIILDCLKKKPWMDLGNSLLGFFEFDYDPVGLWLPIVELDFGQERFLAEEPWDAIRSGRMHAVPYIITQTRDEFYWKAFSILKNSTLLDTMNKEWDRIAPISFMLPRENSSRAVQKLKETYIKGQTLKNDKIGEQALGALYRDSIIGFNVHRLAQLMCRHSPQPVYYGLFSYVGNHSHYEDPDTKKPIGAAHHDDLIYLFTLSYRFPTIPLHSADNQMVEKMTHLWYNFARFGDPNPHGNQPELTDLSWPQMKPEDRKFLDIDSKFSVGSKMFEDRFQVWEDLYPLKY